MAGIKISALPAIAAPALTDIFPVVQAGVTYKETCTQLFSLFSANNFPLSLANGGTAAALTASNGGIVYSNATTMAILAGTATANQVLLSGASSAPHWSTVPYPSASGWTDFTPTVTLVGGAGNTVPTFTTNQGRYQQVGNIVFVNVLLSNTVAGTAGAGTGQVNIALPVAIGASAISVVPFFGTFTNGANSSMTGSSIVAAATTLAMVKLVGTTQSSLVGNDLNDANARKITFSIFYEV